MLCPPGRSIVVLRVHRISASLEGGPPAEELSRGKLCRSWEARLQLRATWDETSYTAEWLPMPSFPVLASITRSFALPA